MVGNTPKMSTNLVSPNNDTNHGYYQPQIDEDINQLEDIPLDETRGNPESDIGFDGKDLNLTSNLSLTENMRLIPEKEARSYSKDYVLHSTSAQPQQLRELTSDDLLKMPSNNFLDAQSVSQEDLMQLKQQFKKKDKMKKMKLRAQSQNLDENKTKASGSSAKRLDYSSNTPSQFKFQEETEVMSKPKLVHRVQEESHEQEDQPIDLIKFDTVNIEESSEDSSSDQRQFGLKTKILLPSAKKNKKNKNVKKTRKSIAKLEENRVYAGSARQNDLHEEFDEANTDNLDPQAKRRASMVKQNTNINELRVQATKSYDNGFININDPDQIKDGAAIRFYQYRENFKNLIEQTSVDSKFDIVNLHITADSQYIIALLKKSDELHQISIYQIEKILYKTRIGPAKTTKQFSIKGTFLKAKEIKEYQSKSGKKIFCVPYIDDGTFCIFIFDLEHYSKDFRHINRLLDIDSSTTTIYGMPDPFINACFINEETIFINLFHKEQLKHHHFLIDTKTGKLKMNSVQIKVEGTPLNFPHDNFYDQKRRKVYVFYRNGQGFTIEANNIHEFQTQQIIKKEDMGQMYLLFNKVLVTRSSRRIIFFRAIDMDNGEVFWEEYHSLENKGFLYYSRRNQRIIITADRLIYFYTLDTETLLPKLEQVLYNFMSCSQLMISPSRNFCVSYKHGQVGFQIYKRKFIHNFLVNLNDQNYQSTFSKAVNTMGTYIIGKENIVELYKQETFKKIQTIELDFDQHIISADRIEARDYGKGQTMEILHVELSHDEMQLAVLVGEKLKQKNENLSYFLFIYKRKITNDNWEIKIKKVLPQALRRISKYFVFNNGNLNEIFVTTEDKIWKYDFIKNSMTKLYKFKSALNAQPIYVKFNHTQENVLLSSFYDVIYVNLKEDYEIDIDEKYQIGDIRSLIYSNNKYYLLANKCKRVLGYYLLEIDEHEDVKKPGNWLLFWKAKLDISDTQMFILDGHGNLKDGEQINQNDAVDKSDSILKSSLNTPHLKRQQTKKSIVDSFDMSNFLIVCFKSIYVNKFIVYVINLKSKRVVFTKERYHLWECDISGLLLRNNDFLTLSSSGNQLMSLNDEYTRKVIDDQNQTWMLHSLSSFRDLKIDKSNSLYFTIFDKEMIIKIQWQFKNKETHDTLFEDLYKVKIDLMTIKDMLLCQSIFSCRQQFDIINLIKMQPNPLVFYKSFLELEKSNLLSILAFDSRAVEILLQEDNVNQIDNKDFPIFYKTKALDSKGKAKIDDSSEDNSFSVELGSQEDDESEEDYEVVSAIDTALTNNQLKAINLMIEYIVDYQNDNVFFFLFKDNFIELCRAGSINISGLLKSRIFYYQFEFMSWPSIHHIDEVITVPYSQTIQNIRYQYADVFKDYQDILGLEYHQDDQLDQFRQKAEKAEHGQINEERQNVYQISYTLNMLSAVEIGDDTLMEVVGSMDDLSVFECEALQDIINFKWNSYAAYVHYIGLLFHLGYELTYSIQIFSIYVYQNREFGKKVLPIQGFFLLWSIIYDFSQAWKQGCKDYCSDMWNLFDQSHIWFGITSLILNYVLPPNQHENELKVITIMVCVLMLVKIFFFLRVFKSMSQMVAMLGRVAIDLGVFLVFYIILIWHSALILDICGLTNVDNASNVPKEKTKAKAATYPGVEYRYLPKFLTQVIGAFRLSLADFDFGEASLLDPFDNVTYWITWLFIVYMTSIVFLNFIIAEVSNSYQQVKDSLDALFLQERAKLIYESEDMMPAFIKRRNYNQFFPKYLIKRDVEQI